MKSKFKNSFLWKSLNLIGLCATMLLLFIKPASAYIDPGSISAVFQGLIAALAAGLVYLKLYWDNIRSLLSKLKKKFSQKKRPE